MSTLTKADVEHIFESLRKGLVPERGIEAFAVGVEKPRGEIHRQLEMASAGEGTVKFLRGGYGCGKTFMARLAVLDAQRRGFATSFVVVSDNDLRFQRFDDVYRKVMMELGTASCPRGALGDILDRWIGKVEQRLVAAGEDDTAAGFDAKVRQSLDDDLIVADRRSGAAGLHPRRADHLRAEAAGRGLGGRGADLLALRQRQRIGGGEEGGRHQGDIESRAALDYLRGVLEIVKAAGYKGLLIVIDEAETILRMRSDSRHKSLNGIRQIADAAGGYPGLLWVFTGTPEFFDTRHGVAGLTPLHDRIRFLKQGQVREPAAGAARAVAVRRRSPAVGRAAAARDLPGGRSRAAGSEDQHRVHRPPGRAGHRRLQGRRRRGAAPVPARARDADGPGRGARRVRARCTEYGFTAGGAQRRRAARAHRRAARSRIRTRRGAGPARGRLVSVFARFAPRLQEAIVARLGWSSLRPVQERPARPCSTATTPSSSRPPRAARPKRRSSRPSRGMVAEAPAGRGRHLRRADQGAPQQPGRSARALHRDGGPAPVRVARRHAGSRAAGSS